MIKILLIAFIAAVLLGCAFWLLNVGEDRDNLFLMILGVVVAVLSLPFVVMTIITIIAIPLGIMQMIIDGGAV